MSTHTSPRFYRLVDLQALFARPTVKATRSVYRQPGFPDPIKIGREYLWPIDDVERFIAEHPTGRVTRPNRPAAHTSRPADIDTDRLGALPLIRLGKAVA